MHTPHRVSAYTIQVTVVKRGKAPPVDNRSGWALSHEVLVTDEVWDATLNQTDVGNNANKYVALFSSIPFPLPRL